MGRVSVKGPQVWKTYSNFCLGISLGSQNHDGEALQSIVAWLNANQHKPDPKNPDQGAGFRQGIIDFSDTLHRYNYMIEGLKIGLSHSDAIMQTMQASDIWLAKNRATLDKITIPHTVMHWNRWLMDDRYPEYRDRFQNAYSAGGLFQDTVHEDVRLYLGRRCKADVDLAKVDPRVLKLSVDFLLEEMAAHSILYEDFPCAVVYPGRQQKSFKMVRAGLVADVPTGMQNSHHTRLVLHNMAPMMQPGGAPVRPGRKTVFMPCVA